MGKLRKDSDGKKILSIATSFEHHKDKYFFKDVYSFGGNAKGLSDDGWLIGDETLKELY